MLPNVQFDPDYTALVYYQIVPESGDPNVSNNSQFGNGGGISSQIVQNDFRLLGFLNASKQSAIFKINPGNLDIPAGSGTHDEGDIDMDSGISEFEENEKVTMLIGISIEPNANAIQQLDCLKVTRDSNSNLPLTKLVPSKPPITQSEILTVSNKIIGNAYNYLSSFTDMNNNVSINKFNDWWDKFKLKMNNDPNYLQSLE